MAYLQRGVHWLIVVGVWFTVSYKPVQCGYCANQNGMETRTEEKTYFEYFPFLKFTVEYKRKYPAYTCCQGYHGEQCDEISDTCRQDASCRGHWCETEEPHYYTSLETMNQIYFGENTRPVRKLCDTPLKKEDCCTGFSGKTCSTKKVINLLSEREVGNIKTQLIIDEGKETKIYTFADVKKFGIGHVIKKEEPEYRSPDNTPVSEERIEEAFTADLHIATSDVTKLFTEQSNEWPSKAKEVVVNIMFNTKIDGFKRIPGLDGALMKGQWHDAATILEDSAWITAVKDRGARLVETLRSLVVIPQDETGDQGEGNFTKWSDWSLCTSRCDRKGLIFDQIKTRSCKPGRICDGEIRKTQSCSIMERDNSDDDYRCKCKNGTCKSKAECNTGLTQAGLCGGNADRICCLPEAKKLACTNEWAKHYACAILDNYNKTKITLRDKDGKGNTYAGPKKNIQDACDGLSASRSYYKDSSCLNPGAPGGEICLTATLLQFIYNVSEMKTGLEVTSLAGHNHGCKSYHYKGKAVDMSKKGNLSAIGNLCRGSLKGFFKDTYDSHWHCTVVKPTNITQPDPDAPCEDINGICQESDEKPCEGGYRVGLCDSRSATRKCCVWRKRAESGEITDQAQNKLAAGL